MRAALALVLALAGLAAGAPGAHASLKSIWGPDRLLDGRSAFPLYKDLGVDVLQRQLLWAYAARSRPADPRNPDDPAYTWPPDLDTTIRKARRNGIRVALMVRATPGWANGGHYSNWHPYDARDYADFMAAAAKRYKHVKHWMIWGEVQRDNTFEPFDPGTAEAPRFYAQMLDESYAALKEVRRSNVVIGGMTLTYDLMTPTTFLRFMRLPNGKPPRLDWFGHNPYGTRKPDIRDRPYVKGLRDINDVDTYIREIRRTYRAIGRKPKLWLSEYSVSSDRSNRAFDFHVSRKEQASWLAGAYRIAHRHRYIAGLGWFNLQDENAANGLTLGLLDTRGRRKPAYYAYRRAR